MLPVRTGKRAESTDCRPSRIFCGGGASALPSGAGPGSEARFSGTGIRSGWGLPGVRMGKTPPRSLLYSIPQGAATPIVSRGWAPDPPVRRAEAHPLRQENMGGTGGESVPVICLLTSGAGVAHNTEYGAAAPDRSRSPSGGRVVSMLHEIGERQYHCEYRPHSPDREKDRLLCYEESRILLLDGTVPTLAQMGQTLPDDALQYLFEISGVCFYLPRTPVAEGNGLKYESIHRLRRLSPDWLAFAGVTGFHLYGWYHRNRYCGACGHPLVHKEDERALVCPACGNILYPGIAVAVIVGILDPERDRLLFSRYSQGYRNYALIAGYNEIGETLEDTVRREVHEEVGLQVKNIRYYKNQPWGFSGTMLLGFFADLDGSPEIRVDHRELSEALWIDRANAPEGDARVSLTGRMMEAFRLGEI